LKQERFQLSQKLHYQYRPLPSEEAVNPVTVKISKRAKKDLESIYGDAKQALREMIQKCSDKQWRNHNTDPWYNTDLTVIKRGNTAERLAGYEDDGVFYIAFVFGNHDEYMRTVPNYKIRDVINDDYVDACP